MIYIYIYTYMCVLQRRGIHEPGSDRSFKLKVGSRLFPRPPSEGGELATALAGRAPFCGRAGGV